ncbi:MAG: hypothetical protein KGL56_10270 [Alphaproteobacteria bacterium]|nr:hypothetical protein [Alphaproteobacteria bacterium]MDE2164233.1 hypothetical protein [Alphaproteobacteria bacterium]MDE2500564.1 hypothetical protein [Alphaproteobacteria bacterium]
MHVIRAIVIFLLGAGFAAGAYISGLAQRLPDMLGHEAHFFDRHFDAAAAPVGRDIAAPIGIRVSSSAASDGGSGCAPVYKFYNHANVPVYLTLARRDDGGMGATAGEIKVPPGGMLLPNGGREGAQESSAAIGGGPSGGGCAGPDVDIELNGG